MRLRRYQNSECRKGWLHKWLQIAVTGNGVLERCVRCGLKMHFPNNISNVRYLSYHIRSILRADDPRFAKEYPDIKV